MDMPVRDNLTEELFSPISVRVYSAPASASLIDQLRPEEAHAIAPMVASRQAEFATARACARAALADFGVDAAIPRGDAGAPAWPRGIAGSISHTRGFCVAVVSDGAHSLGLDVELVERMKSAIERRILVEPEQDALAGLGDETRRRHVTTIFAAKEAFYKAHYEIDPRYLRFDAVSVTVDGPALRFAASSGDVSADLIDRVSGRVRIESGRAIVGVAIDTVGLARPLRSPE